LYPKEKEEEGGEQGGRSPLKRATGRKTIYIALCERREDPGEKKKRSNERCEFTPLSAAENVAKIGQWPTFQPEE